MNQPLVEVREKKTVLVLGIIFTLMFGGMGVFSGMVSLAEGNLSGAIGMMSIWVIFALLGVYMICTYFLHKLQVFSGNRIVYSSYLGHKKEFAFRDIAKISCRDRKNVISLILLDKEGKKLARVESNMANYDKLCEWLAATKKTSEEARATLEGMGMEAQSTFVVEPVKVQGTGKVARFFCAVLGAILCLAGIMVGIESINTMRIKSEDSEAILMFDPYSDTDEKQYISFEMITYSFASFELSDAQGMYFVFDKDMYPYIVCMDNSRLESEFSEIYEYTFSDEEVAPKTGQLEGYAMLIEDDLKEIAIEEFNLLWGEEIVNEENFEDYFGSYYLDSTYVPAKEGENPITSLLSAVFFLVMGIYLVYYAVKGYKKFTKSNGVTPGNGQAVGNVMSVTGAVTQETDTSDIAQTNAPVAGELPVPRNIIVSVLATLVGAALGGVLWMFFYKLDRIAAIAGIVAVYGAMWGWTKFGKRELKTMSTIWCIIAGAGMIILANYLSYAWEIMDALNETSPGRAEFFKILTSMPQLMSEWELWGSFISDLAIGLLLALVAGASTLLGKKKK